MDEPVLSGRVLGGRYTLGPLLGQGGWGAVYAAVQSDLGRPVAVKVLHTSVAVTGEGLARFEREARAAAALGHPNIAQVSDFQANAGEPPFLVMEMLTGKTLGATLKEQKKLPVPRMAWIAYQMLAGLDVAHKAGIVHRDVKPDNVFLVSMPGVEDFVKVLDFGIAKLSGDADAQLTASGSMLGSPAFMAPEQVTSNHLDHRVDIYATGATMYLALSHRMPFNAETVHGLLLAITEHRAPSLHELDPSIDLAMSQLVERAMQKDPAGRFASAAEMRAALEPWLSGVAALGHGASRIVPSTNVMSAFSSTSAPGTVPDAAQMTGGPPMTAGPPIGSSPPMGSPPPGSGPPGFAPQQQAPAYPQQATSAQGAGANPYAASASPQYSATINPLYSPSAMPGGVPPAPQYTTSNAPMTAAPAPTRSGGGAVIGLLVVVVGLLVVLVMGGAGAAYYLSSRAPASASATAPTVSGGATPTALVSVAANGTPVPGAPAAVGAPGAPGVVGGAGARAIRPGSPGAPGSAVGVTGTSSLAPGTPSGAAPAIVVDAGARKQFAGSSFRNISGSFGEFDIDASRAAINRVGGSINACYAMTEFDAPDHQFTNWTFQVDPAGNVKSVARSTSSDPHPKFDGCMIGALRQVKWPASKAGGSPQVGFSSRTRDNP